MEDCGCDNAIPFPAPFESGVVVLDLATDLRLGMRTGVADLNAGFGVPWRNVVAERSGLGGVVRIAIDVDIEVDSTAAVSPGLSVVVPRSTFSFSFDLLLLCGLFRDRDDCESSHICENVVESPKLPSALLHIFKSLVLTGARSAIWSFSTCSRRSACVLNVSVHQSQWHEEREAGRLLVLALTSVVEGP